MRVAILTNEYPPYVYGGAGVHVENLVRELAHLEERKPDLKILCFGDQKEYFDNQEVRGINTPYKLPFKDSRHSKLLDTLLRNVTMLESLDDADIVHCHTWYTHFAGCLLKQLLGIPLILTTHSLEPHRPWKEEQLGAGYKASIWLERVTYESADGIIAVSESMKQDVHKVYDIPLNKIRVIYNGIDVIRYKPTPNPSLLSLYNINSEKPFILFVGRITRQKGIVHLIHAVKYLNPGLQIVFCAGAPDTEEIGKEIAKKIEQARCQTRNEIIWVPKIVPNDHLISLYTHASLFICPSVYEPFGIINLEAMACGTPVVASAVGGVPEVVVHEKTGLLVPFEPIDQNNSEPKDPERFARDLASSINRLIDSPEMIKAMSKRCLQRVDKYFRWSCIAQQTIKFYQELID